MPPRFYTARSADGGTPSFRQDRRNPDATDGNTRHRRVSG